MMMLMMGFWLIVPLLLIGAVVYALVWRSQVNPMGPAPNNQSPENILKARFARGEISREEYDQMLRDLEG